MIVFSQPITSILLQEVSNTIYLCHGNYSLILRDSNGNGWTSQSTVQLLNGQYNLGIYTCTGSESVFNFTVNEPPTLPPCVPDEITLLRMTRGSSYQESFKIVDALGNDVYTQPTIQNTKGYTWTVSLCRGDYQLIMTDSLGNGWTAGSILQIRHGQHFLGSFSCKDSSTTVDFSLSEPATDLPSNEYEEITFIRQTKSYSNEESFYLVDENNMIVFEQPTLNTNSQYIWNVTLFHGNYTLHMTDSYGDGWSSGSTLKIMNGQLIIGEYSCSVTYTCS